MVIRTISDNAEGNAAIDFPVFARDIAAQYAFHIIQQLFSALAIEINVKVAQAQAYHC